MGPFFVVQRVEPIVKKLDLSYRVALSYIYPVFHMNLLRDFRDNGLRQQPPKAKVEGDWKYDIEAIIGHRLLKGHPQYMLSFVRYDASEKI